MNNIIPEVLLLCLHIVSIVVIPATFVLEFHSDMVEPDPVIVPVLFSSDVGNLTFDLIDILYVALRGAHDNSSFDSALFQFFANDCRVDTAATRIDVRIPSIDSLPKLVRT